MASPLSNRLSLEMGRTGQWVFSKEIPSDVLVQVGAAIFPLHKFLLVAKSNYIRKLIIESEEAGLTKINLSDIPGGPEIFEKAAKFCYGINFEITIQNVAALRCAAEYLQLTDNNLAGRTEDFLSQVALSSLSLAILVLKSCEDLLPLAEQLLIVRRCVDVAAVKACYEANFPCRSPANWWTEELSILDIEFFARTISAMKQHGATSLTIGSALMTYTEKSLQDLVRDHSRNGIKLYNSGNPDLRIQQRVLLKSIVSLMPSEKAAFPISFLCCLLRCAIFLKASSSCKSQLEKRISLILQHVTVDDLLVISFTYDGERLFDLESVRKIISGFVEKEKSMAIFSGGDFRDVCSPAMHRVAKTVDTYLGEIATSEELSVSKFNGIANLVPNGSRKFDDDLYRAIDIFLKAHQNLDENEREKVCSTVDPLKLSYEARVDALQNKRLPVLFHALYYDQLKLRSGPVVDDRNIPDAAAARKQLQADVSLVKENEALRSELMKMKLYVSDLRKNQTETTPSSNGSGAQRKHTFFSSMSKSLGKLNPFRHGSKDTLNTDAGAGVDLTKPKRRRFSIS